MERARSLGHVALGIGPGDGPRAAELLRCLGLDVTDNGPSKTGEPWYTAVVDPLTYEGLENLFFVVPTSHEQRAFEATMTDVDASEFLASKRANPESASHIALAYRDLETLEAAVRAVRELDRVSVRVFRAKRGHADVDERMDGSDIFGDVNEEAFVDRTVQVFVSTDLVSTSLLCLGQTIELDYVFPPSSASH
jgi:hypothetical protein